MTRIPQLDFYFVEGPATLSAPSLSLEPTSRSVGQAPQGLPEHLVDAAEQYRRTAEVVERLDREHQRILRAYYAPMLPALRRIYADLGDLAGPMLIMCESAADLASLIVQARAGRRTDRAPAAERLAEAKQEARQAVDAAHRAYRDERRLHDAFREQLRSDLRRRRFEALMRGTAA